MMWNLHLGSIDRVNQRSERMDRWAQEIDGAGSHCIKCIQMKDGSTGRSELTEKGRATGHERKAKMRVMSSKTATRNLTLLLQK